MYYHFWCIFGILFTKYQIDVKRIMFYLIFYYLPAVYFCISRFFAKSRISQFRVFSHLQNGAQDISRTVASIGLIFWHKIHHTLLLEMSHGISQKIWKKKVMNFFLSVPEGIFFKKIIFSIFQWKIEISLIPWLILSGMVTRILCEKISQIERSVLEISWAPFFTHVSIKLRKTGEKLKSVKISLFMSGMMRNTMQKKYIVQ